MKKTIEINQLKELSSKSLLKLKQWYYGCRGYGDLVTHDNPLFDQSCIWETAVFGLNAVQGDPIPILSIGQMIEFLDEHVDGIEIKIRRAGYGFTFPEDTLVVDVYGGPWSEIEDEPELCDALWYAVKSVLEQDDKKD